MGHSHTDTQTLKHRYTDTETLTHRDTETQTLTNKYTHTDTVTKILNMEKHTYVQCTLLSTSANRCHHVRQALHWDAILIILNWVY